MADIHFVDGALVLLLGRTKRGLQQRVLIRDPLMVQWMTYYVRWRESQHSKDRVFPVSYGTVARWLQRFCLAFDLDGKLFTTHSFRRGGATHMLLDGVSVETIMEYGRWASTASARLYLQRGEPFLLRLRGGQVPGAWRRIDQVAAVGLHDWMLPLPAPTTTKLRSRKK